MKHESFSKTKDKKRSVEDANQYYKRVSNRKSRVFIIVVVILVVNRVVTNDNRRVFRRAIVMRLNRAENTNKQARHT
jgi:hypothetical protein